MTAFENATKFFIACEAPAGWAGCKPYVADGATFTAQSEPLAEIKTVAAYCVDVRLCNRNCARRHL